MFEFLCGIADIKPVLVVPQLRFPIIEHILRCQKFFQFPRSLVSRIYQPHTLSHDFPYGGTYQGIMGTSQNQGVNPNVDQFRQIALCDLVRDRIFQKPFFHKRHKEGAGFSDYPCLLIDFFYVAGINTACNRAFRPYHSDLSIGGSLCCHLCPRLHHPYYGYVCFLFYLVQCIGAGSITGCHNSFYLLCL